MWRSRKFIVIAVLAIVLLAGSIGVVAFAQADNGDEGQPEARDAVLLDKVCEIYKQKTGVAIDSEALKDAFIQARGEMRNEALENRLDKLVEDGKITREEADEYLEWWELRPDVPVKFGFRGRGMGGPGGLGRLSAPTTE
jgi:hypothetical protein